MQIPKYFATKNLNKLREVNQILDFDLEHVALDLLEPQGLSLIEIVCAKAKDAYQKFGQPVLVEDTSLEVLAWNGLPGPLIKWFLESAGSQGILKMMESEKNRAAVAKTAFAFFDGENCHTFVGEVQGKIPAQIRGESGFGWDPLFIPEGFDQSFAEMPSEQKNSVSARYRALFDLKKQM